MTKERFESKWEIVIVTVVCLGGGALVGYFGNRGLPSGRDLLIGIAALVGATILSLHHKLTTYLEVKDTGRTLINRGYRDFGHDTLKVNSIRYIYRVPAFIWRNLGALMVIYVRDDEGFLRHSALREMNYPDATLRKFLQRIMELNPSIELDPEYKEFLDDPSDGARLIRPSKSNIRDVEARLRAKGEKWPELSGLARFFNKFR